MNGPTFAHVSDLHLPFEPKLSPRQRLSKRQLSVWSWRRRGAVQSMEVLDALAHDIRRHTVDRILVTGDITNFSLPAEFAQATHWLAALGPPERLSLVPGNHDALVAVPHSSGIGLWDRWMHSANGWPFLHRHGDVALIGLNSALPTAPLLARGRLGAEQLTRLEQALVAEGAAGRVRIVMVHHPVDDGAVGWRKALADRTALQAVLQRAGAELVLYGHARGARLGSVAGPGAPIPCLCVPSSSALPNPRDEGARWHRLRLLDGPAGPRMEVEVRRWSAGERAFVARGTYELCLPRPPEAVQARMGAGQLAPVQPAGKDR